MKMNLKNKIAAILVVGALTVTALWAKPAGVQPANAHIFGTNYVPGEVLIQYRTEIPDATAQSVENSKGLAFQRPVNHRHRDKGPLRLAKVPAGQSVEETISSLLADPTVEFAQPNFIYKATTNDPDYGQLWGLKNTAQTITSPSYTTSNPGTSGKDIDIETAWGVAAGVSNCSTVTVAVVDSGVNYNHEDLSSNMVSGSYACPGGTVTSSGCDFVGTGDGDPMDLNGHGTHVAGTIGAKGGNSTGTTGVCQTASILAVRVLNETGSGTTADIVEGFSFAVATGAGNGNAKVVNMSLGGSSSDTAFSNAILAATDVVVVVAAGNSTQNHNTTAGYPCDYAHSNIICVAAADQAYGIASFSDFDTNSTAANRKVDIAAPGVNIRSTFAGNETVIGPDTFSIPGTWTTVNTSGTAWGKGSCNLGSTYDVLMLPNNCTTVFTGTSTSGYASSTDSKAYRDFTLSAGADSVKLTYYFTADTESTFDFLALNYKNSTGDPFSSGTNLTTGSGELNGSVTSATYSLSSCVGSTTCALGFRFTSDSSVNRAGVGILLLTVTTLDKDATNAYQQLNGTSMASPHVAGIATLVRARNPNFTATDTVNAILAGGDAATAFASNTKTGMVADAYGSMKYIPTPTITSTVSP